MSLRVAIVSNHEPQTEKAVKELRKLLAEAEIKEDPNKPELVISVGGDGTLLSAFHRYNHRLAEISFLGIHTGHLGFYTDWRDYELPELVESLKANRHQTVSYPLLDIRIKYHNGRPDGHFLALNESTIKRGNRTMVTDVYIKDELFERFRGDGLSVSTPTGSTAYNKSVGGAVIHPRIRALQLAEIASLNNRVFRTLGSPIIISDHEWLELRLPDDSGDDYLITVDQLDVDREEVKAIFYKIADETIQFASYRHMHFWHRVRDAFIGAD